MTVTFADEDALVAVRVAAAAAETAMPDLYQGLAVVAHSRPGDDDTRDLISQAWLDWLDPRALTHLWVGDVWLCTLDASVTGAALIVDSLAREFGGARVAQVQRYPTGTVKTYPRWGRA